MKTVITSSALVASEFIRTEELVAFPTETVYGLGASVFSERALKKIFSAKRRPEDNPLIVHIASIKQIPLLAKRITPDAHKLIERFFPGPLTVILPKKKIISPVVSAGLATIAVRMPRHSSAQRLLNLSGVPIAAPSANISGRPSPTTWQAVKHDLNGRIACILKGKRSRVGVESTVVDCTGRVPVVLRAGAVTLEQLRRVVPSVRFYGRNVPVGAKSPGMKHRHYAPSATVVLVDSAYHLRSSPSSGYIGFDTGARKKCEVVKLCRSTKEYAHALFHFFRRCDRRKMTTIYCERVPETGIGVALMDRIRRASSK